MMYGTRKSDRSIVPEKPPNKGGQRGEAVHGEPYTGTKAETPDTAKGSPTDPCADTRPIAEAVEERDLAKGNTDQQNAPRTQSRIRGVTSALDRVREAAKKDHKTRVT